MSSQAIRGSWAISSFYSKAFKIVRIGLFPLAFYAVVFCILTFPLILKFSSHFFTDTGDGLQNIWNIWWVNKAVTELHQIPWHTYYIHFPFGTTLIAHTLNPFNGFLGIALLKLLTLIQTYNLIVLFSFIMGGFTAFLLAFYLTRSYWGSIIAGFIFTFSNYHFTHAEGHLQLVSLEWIPLFVLCWYVFITKPSVLSGAASSIVLFAVVLCDYYYFLYCVMTAIFIVAWYAKKRKDTFFMLKKTYLFPLLAFIVCFLITSFPLIVALLVSNIRNSFIGSHLSKVYSLDLLAPLIPGGHWRFAHLTQFYWTRITGGIHESSVHIGLSVIIVLIYVWISRRKTQEPSLRLWYMILVAFMTLSLGPVLHIWGKEISWFKLPYALFELGFPPLKLGGVPVRMMVMVTLSASVIFAIGFQMLFNGKARKLWVMALLLVVLFVEYLPRPMPSTRIVVPEYINFLKKLPGHKGVIDNVSSPEFSLYFQTIHEKPLAQGYIARVPRRVYERGRRILQLVENRQFVLLYRGYHFQYLISDKEIIRPSAKAPVRVIFDDGKVKLYDLGAVWK